MKDALAPPRPGRLRGRSLEPFEPGAPSRTMPAQEPGFGAADLVGALRRHLTLLGTVMVCVPLLTFAAVRQLPPRYTATANVLLEQTQYSVREIQSIIASLDSSEVLQSQIEVVRSQAMAERIAKRFALDRNPDFEERPGLVTRLLAGGLTAAEPVLRPALDQLGIAWPSDELQPPSAAERQERLAGRVLERIEASIRGRSRVLALGFTAQDPRLAADAANAVAELYITDQLAAKLAAVRRASSWLDDQVASVRGEVTETEERLNQLRVESGLVSGVTADLATEQVSRISTELIQAKGAEAAALARREQMEAARRSGAALDALPQMVQSGAILTLRQQEAQARRELSQALNTYGPGHPDYQRAQSTMADVRRLVGQEVERIAQSFAADAAASSARVASLEEAMDRAQLDAERAARSGNTLSTMAREAEAARSLLATLLVRSQQMAQQTAIEQPDARILSPATVPQSPSSPRTGMIIGGSVALALVIGLALVWLVETLDRSLRTGLDIERGLGQACLALVPELRGRFRRAPAQETVLRPRSAFSEAVRSLRAGLWLQARREPASGTAGRARSFVVLVSSARPGEGKTTLAVALARSAALAGERVLLVDCDLRRPSVARVVGVGETGGLAELLEGRATLDDLLLRDPLTDAAVLTAGAVGQVGPGFLGAGFDAVLERLRAGRDLVVLDAPPVFAMADARLLAALADATVLCARWGSTPIDVAEAALRSLREARAPVAGVVLTRVDTRAHGRSGYADGEIYRSRYRAYFRD